MSDLNNTDAIARHRLTTLQTPDELRWQNRGPSNEAMVVKETHGSSGKFAKQTGVGGETLREAVDCINRRSGVDC
jgi:hypothetical protein